MTDLWGLMLCAAALAALGAVCALPPSGRVASAFAHAGTGAISAVALVLAARALLFATAFEASVLPLGVPWLGAHFRLDPLSAAFAVLVNLGAAAAALYGLSYGAHEPEPRRVAPFLPLFIAGMNGVLLADDAYVFLLSWEAMSLASWALVRARHRQDGNGEAAFVYLVMASAGALALLMSFGLLSGAGGDYAFEAMRKAPPTGLFAVGAFLLALLSAGSKAGLAPFHAWLPLAHPAAPSQVSALMSGVMTKVAVYGFVRIAFDLMGPADWRIAIIPLALGALSGFIGVLNALMETDLKRALAYSTIENVGLVFMGLGLALAFKGSGLQTGAELAFTAALLHAFNHSLFKSEMFFVAGSVQVATGEHSLSRLGGLLNRMPRLGFLALAGVCAISALPPLNGFVSEWMLLQSALLGPQFPQWTMKIAAPAAGATVALIAALAAACFMRFYGTAFLGRPRSEAARNAKDADALALAAMGALALLCLLGGIFPGPVIDALSPVAHLAVSGALPEQTPIAWLTIAPVTPERGTYNGLLVFLFIGISASLAASAIHRLASDALRRAPPWDCGFPQDLAATQYTPESFSQPIRRVFGRFALRAQERVDMPAPGDLRPATLSLTMRDVFWDALYLPAARAVGAVATRLDRLQFLTIRLYLSIVFGLLILLLLAVATWT